MKAAIRRVSAAVRDFWIDDLWVDFLIVTLILATHVCLVVLTPIFDVFGNALPSDRRAVYAAAAVVVSLLGSFSAVAIGQLGAAKGERTTALKQSGGKLLAKNWQSIFRGAMGAALVALAALLLDPSVASANPVHVVVRWIFEAAMLLAIVKFVRLSALFYEVISLTTLEAGEGDSSSSRAAAPQPNPNWHNKAS